MENRNFHTSLLGGFRKKDVVSFLAEEKSRQDSALQELQQQITEAEEQLQGMMEERDQALERVLELRQQLADVQEQLADAQSRQDELEDRVNEAALREQAMASQSAQSQAEALQLSEENSRLQARIEELEARPEPCIQVDPAELDSLRQQLQAEQQKTRELAALLQQQPQSRSCAGESMDQLWSLCGKMERTLGQMERMLDGPYRMTCYPEPPVDRVQAEPVMPAEEPVPVAESAPVTQAPSVKSLLQRIRKH